MSQDNLPVESVVTAATKAGVMKTATYYSDFGTPVTVKRPPAYDTADFADLMKQQQAG
ncbi:hypothetical protein [Streptomyces sp. IBSBF 2435]|uniref:hypothetical protein n=1 Tax=Streptomyces sp. IBSBF 2435 TaxID=2903531 RepID=UPI002FDBCFE6